MKRTVQGVSLYGLLGSGNLGNDASLETVLSWFRTHHPHVELSCITIAPKQVHERYGLASAPLAWRPRNSDVGRLTATIHKGVGRLLDIVRSYRAAGWVDAVIVPGMGVLEDSLTGRPWGMPYWLFIMALACRVRGRHFVLLGVGAERASNPVTRWLFAATARLATHASYRDRSSAAAMARPGRQLEKVAPDIAFAHPSSTAAEPNRGHLVVGVMAFYGAGDDPVRGAAVRRRYVTTLADAIAALTRSQARIVLVGGDEDDFDVAREVQAAVFSRCPELSEGVVVVRETSTFAELADEMRTAEAVVASRFHNLICALRLGRPTVSVGYAGKSRELMEAVGLDDYVQDISQLDADRLVAQVQAVQRDTEVVSAQLRYATAGFRGEVVSLLQHLTEKHLGLDVPAGDLEISTQGTR